MNKIICISLTKIQLDNTQIQLPRTQMFVKQSYDNRLKKEQLETNNRTLLKKNKAPVIGSIRNDKINYDQDEEFFAKEDVPEKARTIKNDVKKYIDPDHLGLRKRQWNTSVSVPRKIQAEQTHEQRLLKIKLGFLDHPLPKYKQPKIYEGTDLRNDYTNWNVSNEVSRKDFKDGLMKKTMSALENSKLKQKQFLTQYMDPLLKTTNHIESFKNDWKEKQQLRMRLLEKYQFDNPTASEEKKSGAVFRLVYETMIKERKDNIQAQAMKTDFKATLSGTQKSRIGVRSSHTGIWQSHKEKVGDQIEQTWAWSCCMNEDQNSMGCSNKIKDGNKWNLISFNA